MNSLARSFACTKNEDTHDDCMATWFMLSDILTDTMHTVNQVICNFETGESGNPHLQLHFDCRDAIRPSGLVRAFPILEGAHFEPCNNLAASRKYCRAKQGEKAGIVWHHEEYKREGYMERYTAEVGGAAKGPSATAVMAERCADFAAAGDSWSTVSKLFAKENPLVYMRNAKTLKVLYDTAFVVKKMEVTLRPWQKMIEEKLDATPPDGRTIYWIYDRDGNNGKTFFAEYLLRNRGAGIFDGRVQDMAYAYTGQPIVCMDIARGQADNMQHLHVTAEKLAGGSIFSAKYESQYKIYDNKPHVIVFANVRHNEELWTAGRCIEIDLPAWIAADALGPAIAIAQAQAVRFM